MIIRRDFLKSMAFAALATVLPEIPLPTEPVEWTETVDPLLNTTTYHATQYAIGFTVTAEMLEDDIYGTVIDAQKELVTRYRMATLDFNTGS